VNTVSRLNGTILILEAARSSVFIRGRWAALSFGKAIASRIEREVDFPKLIFALKERLA
jgi:hypothetical protein